ncbi:hypothetical protein JL721_9021 [Aureococcus anophagefferens]|nr:hypothetical protein JL721_9021 [Aureococcus anophagefferens]
MLLSSLILLLSSQSVFAFASPPQAPRPPAMVAAAATGAGALAPAAELHGALVAYDGDAQLKARIDSALRVLEDAFRVFGGDAAGASPTPRLVFFDASDDFDEVRRFAGTRGPPSRAGDVVVEPVALDVGFVAGLEDLVARSKPRPLAFVLGTRRGDPNCGDQKAFEPSSDWMPPFMRVNPILDWTYGDVWAFLRAFDLPYCALYDGGYTSLGSAPTTSRNPAPRQRRAYKPAHLLEDWSLERAGRVSKKKPSD